MKKPTKEQLAAVERAKNHNRIWIELDKPRDEAHAEEQCRLANLMLAKLMPAPIGQGVNENTRKFFVGTSRRLGLHYCYGGPMGYTDLVDNGEWFNLDYIAEGMKAAA